MNEAPAVMTLEAWLEWSGTSQVKLARLAGVTPNTVYRWLEGLRRPEWGMLERLAEISGGRVTADSFLPRAKAA